MQGVRADPPPSASLPSTHYSDSTSLIYALAFASSERASDFIAVGGEFRVDVLQRDHAEAHPKYGPFKSFYLGARVTALAWSPRVVSPSSPDDEYLIELAVSCADNHIRILTASKEKPKGEVTIISEGVDGHRARINDICFCSSEGSDGFLATVSDDKSCIIWNLNPAEPTDDVQNGLADGPRISGIQCRIPHPDPLLTVSYHPMRASQILTCSSAGELVLYNWSPNESDQVATVIELMEPGRLTRVLEGKSQGSDGCGADWKPNDADTFGAVFGQTWHIWDLKYLRGIGPVKSGQAHSSRSGNRFRWCPTNPSLFATASFDPFAGPSIKIYNTSFTENPRSLSFQQGGDRVRAFDWSSEGEWIAVAIGRKVIFASAAEPVE